MTAEQGTETGSTATHAQADVQAAAAFGAIKEAELPGKDLKILVIEDAASMRGVEKSLLKEMGFEHISEAACAKEGLAIIDTKPLDIIICDWELPDQDGLSILEYVRQHDKAKEVPFLMVTSNVDAEKVKQAITAGVSDYIAKPFQQNTFCDKIAKVLSKRKPH